LAGFYARVIIPPSVVLELERGRAMGHTLPDVHLLSWIEIRTPGSMDRVPDVAALGAGEKEVLALGLQFRDAIVILEERLGRLCGILEAAGHGHAWNLTPSEAGRPDHARPTSVGSS
jgi:predicted nucleic acid-binding protein